jgi:histidinol-phosphatase (PHP family)
MHTHHSHSGQYCGHAKDQLQSVIDEAKRQKFKLFALTEHIPRFEGSHLYPEEIAEGMSLQHLKDKFEAYKSHAKQIQKLHESRQDPLVILVGCEIESLGPASWQYAVKQKEELDFIVGSVHHVAEIPIDYDRELWNQAMLHVSSNESEPVLSMFEAYFELQYQMLEVTQPQVVGHFDLIKLMAPESYNSGPLSDFPEVWSLVCRNIDYAIEIGALFEINAAALRKGWSTPYPQRDVATRIIEKGGKFCLSDDSHGVAQVGLNYTKCIDYLEELGVEQVWYLTKEDGKVVSRSETVKYLRAALL